jgi:Rrf2 family protein
MQIPVKAHYAAIAMLALAARYQAGELISARTVSAEHDVPNQFLVQILQQLRSAGLVCSSRGANGGFKLQRTPDSITLAEIVDAVCSPQQLTATSEVGDSDLNRVMSQVWDEVIQQQRKQLEQRTLQSLLDQALTQAAESMFYI